MGDGTHGLALTLNLVIELERERLVQPLALRAVTRAHVEPILGNQSRP